MRKIVRVDRIEAVKIAYYLMAVDGKISECEENYLNEIAEGFGINEPALFEDVIIRTNALLNYTSDSNLVYKLIKNEVDKIIEKIYNQNSQKKSLEIENEFIEEWLSKEYITPNIIIWNLMTMAIKDLDYSENEKMLINFVAKKFNIDRSILVEMDNAIRALYSIQNELEWINKNIENKSEISKLIDELINRRKIIENSIKLFIYD